MENQNALALIPDSVPAEARQKIENYIEAVRRQNIATLGDGQVFFKKDGDGFVKSVSGALQLREDLGQVAVIQGRPMITATGYYDENKIASCTIITPDHLVLPITEKKVPNPYPIIDEKSQSISKVWVKKMCLGRNPVGNWVITSCTLLYDINMYFLQDCYKKISKNKNAGKITMRSLVKSDELPLFFPIQGDMGIVINTNDNDIIYAIDNMIQRKLFAERNAQTICERIVMRKHPAFTSNLEVSGAEKKRAGKVKVVGWVDNISKEELLEIAKKLERGDEVEIDGHTVSMTEETYSEVPEEDLRAGEVEADETANNAIIVDPVEEEDQEDESPAQPASPTNNADISEKATALRTKIIGVAESLGKGRLEEALKKGFGGRSLNDLREKQLEMLFNILKDESDKGATM